MGDKKDNKEQLVVIIEEEIRQLFVSAYWQEKYQRSLSYLYNPDFVISSDSIFANAQTSMSQLLDLVIRLRQMSDFLAAGDFMEEEKITKTLIDTIMETTNDTLKSNCEMIVKYAMEGIGCQSAV